MNICEHTAKHMNNAQTKSVQNTLSGNLACRYEAVTDWYFCSQNSIGKLRSSSKLRDKKRAMTNTIRFD